jgi:hypothetical protein
MSQTLEPSEVNRRAERAMRAFYLGRGLAEAPTWEELEDDARVGFRAIIRALDRGELDCDHVWLFDVRTAHPIARHCEHCGKREYRKDVNDD